MDVANAQADVANPQDIADKDITRAIETEMLTEEGVPSYYIDVGTTDGVVTLSGSVDTLRAKDRAMEVAQRVKGVRSVINQIEVRTIPRPDARIREDAVDALLYDPATETYEVDVEVADGVVTLTGSVDSWQEKQLAAEVVKGVKGVAEIRNQIQVEFETDRPDHEIQTDVEGQLESDIWVDEGLIDVQVENGEVTLTGTVGSAAEKTWATNNAWVAGVSDVNNEGLEVEWWARHDMERQSKLATRSDAEIKQSIKDAFLYDPRVFSFEPNVEVEFGIVTLEGTVDNLAAKRAAEADAENTRGVLRVKNYLKVRPTVPIGDDEITERVRNALTWDLDLDPEMITVFTRNGLVTLYGHVDSEYEKSIAEDIVTRVNGVVAVDNKLTVTDEWTWQEDWEIEQDIQDQLFWSPFVDRDQVAVTVQDGVATLIGTVDSWRERNAAAENAYEGGAQSVQNHLRVSGGFNWPLW